MGDRFKDHFVERRRPRGLESTARPGGTPCPHRKLWFLYVCNALESLERAELDAHRTRGCDACERAVSEAWETVGEISLVSGPGAVPSRIKGRLVTILEEAGRPRSLCAANGTGALKDRPRGRGQVRRWTPLAAAAVLGMMATAASWWGPIHKKHNRIRKLENEVTSLQSRPSGSEQPSRAPSVAAVEAGLLSILAGRRLRVVRLTGETSEERSVGRLFFQPAHDLAYVFAPELGDSRRRGEYRSWLLNSENELVQRNQIDVRVSGREWFLVEMPKQAVADASKLRVGYALAPSGPVALTAELDWISEEKE